MRSAALKEPAVHEVRSAADYRLFLQDELMRRCRANPRYSLRAFAAQLKLNPSYLSKILSAKRSVTPALIRRLAPALGLDPTQTETFLQFHQTLRTESSADTAPHEATYQQLTLDSFQVIADWYHYAILEVITLRDFEPKLTWVAKKLDIKVHEARIAVERLQRLEMLEVTADGRWVNRSGSNTTTANAFTAVAFRKLQHQILAQAGDALEGLPIEERDQGSMTMAFDSRLLPEAKARIKKFRRELCAFLQTKSQTRADHVYQFTTSLFPVTRTISQKGRNSL